MLRVLCTIASVCASIFFGHLLYVFSTVSVSVCHTLCVLCHCVCFVQVAYLCLCWTARWPTGKNLNAVQNLALLLLDLAKYKHIHIQIQQKIQIYQPEYYLNAM